MIELFGIERCTDSQVDEVAWVLAEAFEADPVMAGFVQDGANRRERIAALFAALVRSGPLRHGAIDVAIRKSDGSALGVAVWESPGKKPGAAIDFIGQIPRYIHALGPAGTVRALRHLRLLGLPRPRMPHWYLAQIGVSHSARGLGVGTALIQHRLRHVDLEASACYLESSTERNRSLYRKLGFLELGTIPGLAAAPAAMWRPAST